MSNTDSFIDEVTDEVRRDRLYALAKKYGWIVVVGLVLIIGAAAFQEWSKARQRASAEMLGDSLRSAMNAQAPLARATALQDIAGTPDAEMIARFLAAGELAATDGAKAGELLQQIAAMPGLRPIYRDLATLKLTMIPDYPMMSDEKLTRLEPLTAPGAPFRVMALEQMAAVHIERHDTAEALAILKPLLSDADASGGARQRAQSLIIALGGDGKDS